MVAVELSPAVAVLGAGAWGTALALHLSAQGHRVRLWTWRPEHAERIERDRENVEFFRGFPLTDAVHATADLASAVAGADAVVLVVPSLAVRATLRALAGAVPEHAVLIVASKGIEVESLMLLTEVVGAVLGAPWAGRAVALSGPSFAQEVARGLPTNLVAASHDAAAALAAQRLMSGDRVRVYTSDDPVGVEVGGALKNVIAIAAGASDGLGYGHNTRAALITRGLAEMARLAVAKGGSTLTLAGLAGLGDLVLTATAELSRNRTVGFELGRGRALEDVLGGLGHVAEGVTTAQSAFHLSERLGVELPICSEVYRVLFQGKPVHDAVRELLLRPLGREWR